MLCNACVVYIVSFFFAFLSKFCCIFSETVLKLDTLVGDIEDSVSSIMNKTLRKNSSLQNSEVSTLSFFVQNQMSIVVFFFVQGKK